MPTNKTMYFIPAKVVVLAAATLVGVVAASGAVSAQERVLKIGLNGPEGHPAVAGLRKFADVAATKSGGKIKVNIFLSGALGSDQAVVSSLKGGTVEMAVMNTGILASEAKELAVFDFPFLFANEKESDAIVDGPIGRKMHGLLEAKGLVGLAYWELGYRQITNSKRAILKVDDIAGLKLRVIPNPINVEWVKALGANPTPLPFPEVYGALDQGAIDGQENPISVIAANKFWEVQKYAVLSNHQYNPQSVIISKKVWDAMSAVEREAVADAAKEATQTQRQSARAAVAADLAKLKANGMTVTELPQVEVAKLREKIKPVIEKFSATVGEDIVKEIGAELAKMRN